MSDARWNDPREDDVRDRGERMAARVRPTRPGRRPSGRPDARPRLAARRGAGTGRGSATESTSSTAKTAARWPPSARFGSCPNTISIFDARHPRNLHDRGLVETVDLGDERARTDPHAEGRDLLDSHSLDRDREPSQTFYAGVSRSREIDHDSNLYATFRQEEARLRDEHPGLEIRRVVLEQDLKREYQEFLQDHNRGRADSDGRPGRDENEIRDWAREHDLPYFDEQVHFPDYRIEYEVDGREHHQDVELFTEHYRGAHAASHSQTGFRIYVVGSRGGGGRSGPHPRGMEEFL